SRALSRTSGLLVAATIKTSLLHTSCKRKKKHTTLIILRPAAHASSPPGSDSSSPCDSAVMPAAPPDFKEELLSSLRIDMAAIFKTELQAALSEHFTSIKTELQSVKSELSGSITNIQVKVSALESTVVEMETSLSTYSDDIASLQSKVELLSAELLRVDNKCEDLEARSRRNNIRIIGVPEDSTSSSTMSAVSILLKEAFQLDKEPILDRAHRSLQAKPKPGERPRPIIARLHYHTDCVDILRRARAQQRIKVGDMAIHIFPDHTAKTARARAAFNDIRRQLREITLPGLRYGLLYPARLRITYDGTERVDLVSSQAVLPSWKWYGLLRSFYLTH
uniref:Transposase element L1Md-A101/L1Md-A102/L1Md-A2 n=1 Tax=Cyprinus carpio carpio TaxID=630221 RepID=A0A9J7ZW30_CYPCA